VERKEALLNLLRTSDCLHRASPPENRDWGVTSTQYNVSAHFGVERSATDLLFRPSARA